MGAGDPGEGSQVSLDGSGRRPEFRHGSLDQGRARSVDAEQTRERDVRQDRVAGDDHGVRLRHVREAATVGASARRERVEHREVRAEVPCHLESHVGGIAPGHLGDGPEQRVEAPGIRVDEVGDGTPDDDAGAGRQPRPRHRLPGKDARRGGP